MAEDKGDKNSVFEQGFGAEVVIAVHPGLPTDSGGFKWIRLAVVFAGGRCGEDAKYCVVRPS